MRTIVLALGLLAAASGSARAQITPWQPEPPPAGWSVTPGIGVGFFHDSNLVLRADAPASGEWAALVQPRADLDFVGRRTRFAAGYSGALQASRSADYVNRYQQRARVGSSRVLSRRLTVRGDGSYTFSPTTEDVQDGTIPFAAVGSHEFTATGAFDGTISRRARLNGSYRFHRLQYEDGPDLLTEFALLRGGYAHTPAARLGFDMTSRLTFEGDWSYTAGEVDGAVGTFRLQYFGGGWRYRLSEHTTFGAGGGATSVRAPFVDIAGWRPAARAFVEQQAGPNTLSVQYSYAIVPAFSHGGLSRQQRVAAGVHVPLLVGRTYVTGSLALSRDEALEGLGSGLDTRTLWLQGAVGYHLARWLRAEGFVNGARQSSLAHDGQAVQRMRIGVQFVTAKPMRID